MMVQFRRKIIGWQYKRNCINGSPGGMGEILGARVSLEKLDIRTQEEVRCFESYESFMFEVREEVRLLDFLQMRDYGVRVEMRCSKSRRT